MRQDKCQELTVIKVLNFEFWYFVIYMDLGMGNSWPSEGIGCYAQNDAHSFLGAKVGKEPAPFSKVWEVLMGFKSLPKSMGLAPSLSRWGWPEYFLYFTVHGADKHTLEYKAITGVFNQQMISFSPLPPLPPTVPGGRSP